MRTRRRPGSARVGMALMAVLLVTALAAILGSALLSSSAIQSRAAGNAADVQQAELLADSGIQFALYCLSNPDKSPELTVGAAGNTHYPGGSSLPLLGSDGGVVDVLVTNPALDQFTIVSTGRFGAARRAFEATVEVPSEYRVAHAVSAAADANLASTTIVNGSLRTDGVATLASRGSVRGPVYALNGESIANGFVTPTFPTRSNPAWNELNLVKSLNTTHPVVKTLREYYLDGHRYYAEPLPTTFVTGRLQTLNVLVNPANVWYANTTVTLHNAEIDGTIIVRGGGADVIVEGTNVVRSARSDLPAIVTRDDLLFRSGMTAQLSVEGILWIGDDISVTSGSSTNCSLQVRGAMLLGGTGSIVRTGFRGPITIDHDPEKVRAPDLSNSNRWPTSLRVLSWRARQS